MSAFNKVVDICSIAKQVNKEFGFDVIYAAITGSCAMGVNNVTSDIDLFMLVDNKCNENMFTDGKLKVIRSIEGNSIEIIIFPVWYFLAKKDDDYYVWDFISRFLNASEIWISDINKNEIIEKIYLNYKVTDVVDAYLVRAEGNYNKFISVADKIPARKYLYTLNHIFSVRMLLENRKKPSIKFYEMAELLVNDKRILPEIKNIYKINKDSTENKETCLCQCSEELNRYIVAELKWIKEIRTGLSETKTVYDILCNEHN